MNQDIKDKIAQHFSKGKTKRFVKGEIITHAGQEPEYISFLESGLVEQYEITAEGSKFTVNVFKPFAFFPMSWAINKTPNLYFFGALTDVELRRADVDETVAFLKNNPEVTFDLLSRVYRGTDGILKRLSLAARGVATNRLILELLIEAYRFGDANNEKAVTIKVKQKTLADRSGLAKETVSRELAKLEQEKLISRTRAGIKFYINELQKRLEFNI